MQRSVPLLALVLAVSARGDRVHADAPATFDLGRKEVWKAGDIVTETVVESEDEGYSFTVPGAEAPKTQTRASKTTAVLVKKCVEADLDGGLTKAVAFVKTWSFDNGHGADTSLEGAFVEAKGRGKDRVWRVIASLMKPSDAANAWLERNYGASRPEAETVRRMWLPKAPVAVGDAWSADLSPFLDAKFDGAPIDRANATSKVRLADVQNDVAKIACEAKIPFTGVPGKKGADPLPWKSGGVLALTGEVTVRLAHRLGGGATSAYTLEGKAEKDGKSFGVEVRSTRRQQTEIGGVLPEAPAIDGAK